MGKRGPKPGSKPRVTDALELGAVCDLISVGTSLSAIAEQYKVSLGSLIAWISETPERAARTRTARQEAAKLWDEEATRLIAEATDGFALSKAKELAHHYRWRASKIAPREYGERLELAGDIGVNTMSEDQIDAKIAALAAKKLSESK